MAEITLSCCIEREKALTVDINKGIGMGELPSAVGVHDFASPAYSVNGTDLTAVQSAISAKSGVASPAFPGGFVEAVEGIAPAFYDSRGKIYTPHVVTPPDVTALIEGVYDSVGIKSIYATEVTSIGGHYCFGSAGNVVETIIAPKLTDWAVKKHWCFRGTALKFVQAGSIGYPVTCMDNNIGFSCTTRPTIEVYVDAVTIDEIPSKVKSTAPWGATNATIIYRNSNTGEVITA